MDACYVPNNPQYGLSQLEYGSYQDYPQQEEGAQPGCCGGLLHDCHLLQCQDLPQPVHVGGELEDFGGHQYDCDVQALRHCAGLEPHQGGAVGEVAEGCAVQDRDQDRDQDQDQDQGGCWATDDMGSFSLPPLDLDPLPSLFPFSPCSASYKGELKEKQPHEVADVLLSLKHAVVHPGAELAPSYSQQDMSLHPQMMMGGPGCYEPCGPSVFPTMSVNVSMNMTMHGYPPDQMCPQMQWGQNPPASPMNMMYSQNQGMLSPAPYPGSATYSFTADFRPPNQSDPLITATSSFKPIQISSQKSAAVAAQSAQNYGNIFAQKPPVQPGFGQKQGVQGYGQNGGHMRTRSSSISSKIQLQQDVAPTYQILGGQNQGHHHSLGFQQHVIGNGVGSGGVSSPMAGGGKVQIGSLSGCSESEDEQKPNLCRICGKTYARPSTLKTHLRTHSGERPYRCADCNKSFSQAANLTAHVRTHTGQKPFRCPICDRRFSQSSSVTTHMRTHSGERPYRCRACKKAFSDSSTLTKHLRIHSGEKPYQCKLCLLRFSQSGNLNRHMRVHGNNGALLG